MNWLVVQGVKPWDGRYEFDLEHNELTTREWGWIKRLTGYLPLTVEEGLTGADPELFACFAALMIRRAGRTDNLGVQEVFDRIVDAPFGSTVQLESDPDEEEADDESPPPESSSGSESSSGEGGTESSGSSTGPQNGVGMLVSASSGSGQLTSGS